MTHATTSSDLALNGGAPLRTAAFPDWPVYDASDEQALIDVLHSGRWFLADRVDEFERVFAAYQDARYGVCVSSGTTAVQVALEAAGVRAGDEVIVPSYTFVATASAVATVGAVPVFVDVDPETYNIDPVSVEAALTEGTRAVIAVHIAGQPADLDALGDLAGKHGFSIIEDSAQAHGAAWKGRKIGAIGDLGTFSFQASKNLNAGEGGFITTDDEDLANRAWSLHNCGRSPEGAWYEHPLVGANYRLTEFQAGLLLNQIQRLDGQMETRSRNAALLTSLLSEIDGIAPLEVDSRVTRHAYHLYIFRYNADSFGGASRDRFIEALQAEGIPSSSGYLPLYGEPAFAAAFRDYPFETPYFGGKPDYSRFSCPVTERICADEAVWLTQNLLLGSEQDTRDIAAAVAKIREHASQLT